MAITAVKTTRAQDVVTVTVTSDLSGTIYYHWYLDGAFIAASASPVRSFLLPPGDQARLDVLDTTDPDFDSFANAPDGYPARRTLWWVRSVTADVAHYRVEQQREAEGWLEIGRVAGSAAWSYSLLTPRLDDRTNYSWRLIPVDQVGNDGTTLALGSEFIVRTPDAPNFTITHNPGTNKVTFTEAA